MSFVVELGNNFSWAEPRAFDRLFAKCNKLGREMPSAIRAIHAARAIAATRVTLIHFDNAIHARTCVTDEIHMLFYTTV